MYNLKSWLQQSIFIVAALILLSNHLAKAQMMGSFRDERELYAETKQINQFIRRFNSEESINGTRLYAKDSLYRNVKNRLKFLKILFNNENTSLSDQLKNSFADEVTSKSNPVFLDFHGGDWFAEVSTLFLWHGKEQKVKIFLKIQEEKVGSKWVMTAVDFGDFSKQFKSHDTTKIEHFIHPMSHELDFMNLYKVFGEKESVEEYTSRDFEIDQLSLFLYEFKQGNLKFKTVSDVKFHFFQVNNWYFEVSKFNRKGTNTGWLISNLVQLHDEKEKKVLMKYIHSKD